MKNYHYKGNKKSIECSSGEVCDSSNYLNSDHWRMLRKEVYDKNKGVCERCGAVLPSSHMNVHHKTYKHIGNEKIEELCLLCETCHGIIHGKIANEDGCKQKDSDYFVKQQKRKSKTKKRICRYCEHMKMFVSNGKVKYKCDIHNRGLDYESRYICGKFIRSNNSITNQVKKAVALEIQDNKTDDYINKKYRISKKKIAKIRAAQ